MCVCVCVCVFVCVCLSVSVALCCGLRCVVVVRLVVHVASFCFVYVCVRSLLICGGVCAHCLFNNLRFFVLYRLAFIC